MSTQTKSGQRPFGIEYLEPVSAPPRGRQTVTGPAEGCCVTYNSSIEVVIEEDGSGSGSDNVSGSAFCDDIDLCVNL